MRRIAGVDGGKAVIAAGKVDGCRCLPCGIEHKASQWFALILNRNRS